jgi:hypothetical protein
MPLALHCKRHAVQVFPIINGLTQQALPAENAAFRAYVPRVELARAHVGRLRAGCDGMVGVATGSARVFAPIA